MEQTKEVQYFFEEKLNELKKGNHRSYKILASELFRWGSSRLSAPGQRNIGDLIEEQIRMLSNLEKIPPHEIVRGMFDEYQRGNTQAFTSLFYYTPKSSQN